MDKEFEVKQIFLNRTFLTKAPAKPLPPHI